MVGVWTICFDMTRKGPDRDVLVCPYSDQMMSSLELQMTIAQVRIDDDQLSIAQVRIDDDLENGTPHEWMKFGVSGGFS